MEQIEVRNDLTEKERSRLGVTSWPIWSCGVSQFAWTYDARETCFLLEGEVVVTPDGGDPVTITARGTWSFSRPGCRAAGTS